MMQIQTASRRLWCKSILAAAVALLSLQAAASDFPVGPDGFKQIKVAPGYAVNDQFIGVLMPFLQDHPEPMEDGGLMEMTVRPKDNGYEVNIIKDGYRDDSVRGEHWRGFVIPTGDGKWELLNMAVKYLCYRGRSESGICT